MTRFRLVEKRLEGPYGRDYIEQLSAEDAKYGINSKGMLARNNAYGELVAVSEDGRELPYICGHGGSMWLCRSCKEDALRKQDSEV